VRITSKGQVTIPQDIRERTGLLPDTEVDFIVEEAGVRLVKVRGKRATRGAKAVARLRSGGRGITMTTDEILALSRGDE
jgi:AbrB family looped-hinge helix DNA binding protein